MGQSTHHVYLQQNKTDTIPKTNLNKMSKLNNTEKELKCEDIPVKKSREKKLISNRSNPTLSLCMIVKDEEKSLPICLDSVKDYVDEIIIVDTGSTDNTIDIARRYNAKIYQHPWENSFSKARNYSLKYATCDWVLILDADEEIDKEDAHKLKEVIKDPVESETSHKADLIFIPVYSKFNNGKNVSIANSERIFRNHLGICYEGIVHNTLKYSVTTKKENIRLHHYGYNLDNEQMDRKFTRTAGLLKEQIKNGPEDPIPYHYLAISYLDRNLNDECIRNALEAIRLFELQNSESQLKLLSYYSVSVAFYRKNELDSAEKYAKRSLDFYSEYVDAYCLLSSIYFLKREYDKCIDATEKYLDLLRSIKSDSSSILSIPYNTLQHAKLAYSRMAIIFFERGQEEKGHQALKNAINHSEEKWGPYLDIVRHFTEQKKPTLAQKFLVEGLKKNPGNKQMLYYAAQSNDIYHALTKTNPNSEVLVELGTLFLHENDSIRAKECFLILLNSEKYLIEAHLGLSKVYISINGPESCIKSCDELLKYLNLPRNIIINSLSDLSNLYVDIGTTLTKQQKGPLARLSFEIAVLLEPDALKTIQSETAYPVVTG